MDKYCRAEEDVRGGVSCMSIPLGRIIGGLEIDLILFI